MLAQNTLSTPGLCTAGNVAYALLAWVPTGSACLPARMSQMQGFQTPSIHTALLEPLLQICRSVTAL